MWMASGGQLSSFTGQLHLKQDSDFHLNRIPNHAWSHWLAQVFGTYTLDGLGLQTMWKPRSVPSDIHWKENTGLLALSCWVVSAGIELHRMLPIFPQSWEGRKWAETEEATMPERPFSFVLSVSSSSIISSSSYSFLIHFHLPLLFYFLFSSLAAFPLPLLRLQYYYLPQVLTQAMHSNVACFAIPTKQCVLLCLWTFAHM